MTGTITTVCAVCGKSFRVLVTFADNTSPFIDTHTTCPFCKTALLVTDLNQYTNKGVISNEMPNL